MLLIEGTLTFFILFYDTSLFFCIQGCIVLVTNFKESMQYDAIACKFYRSFLAVAKFILTFWIFKTAGKLAVFNQTL